MRAPAAFPPNARAFAVVRFAARVIRAEGIKAGDNVSQTMWININVQNALR